MPARDESADERAARRIVERHLDVALCYCDKGGDVDYRFEIDGRPCVLEVTRYTRTDRKKSRDAWERIADQILLSSRLSSTWLVSVEGQPTFRGLPDRLETALVALEEADVAEYESIDAEIWAHDPRLTDAVAALETDHVQHAYRIPARGAAQLLLVWANTDVGHGPGLAAAQIERFVAADIGNLGKLGTIAAERHLWLWLDESTEGSVVLPFHRPDLPEFPIALPREVTHLWVCEELSGHGWRYSEQDGWSHFGRVPH